MSTPEWHAAQVRRPHAGNPGAAPHAAAALKRLGIEAKVGDQAFAKTRAVGQRVPAMQEHEQPEHVALAHTRHRAQETDALTQQWLLLQVLVDRICHGAERRFEGVQDGSD